MTQTRTPAWTLGHGEPAEETYDQKCERLRLAGAVELSRRYTERSGWTVCSPEWIAAGNDCHNAPRRLSGDPRYSHEHPAAEETAR